MLPEDALKSKRQTGEIKRLSQKSVVFLTAAGTLCIVTTRYGYSQNGLGWKGPQKSRSSNSPPTGNDANHQIKLLRASSILALNTFRDRASMGNLFQCFTTLLAIYFFPNIQSKFTCFYFKTITLCPSTTLPCVKQQEENKIQNSFSPNKYHFFYAVNKGSLCHKIKLDQEIRDCANREVSWRIF